ncbi:MAG: GNAT family N-acetyltransferase, partial [Firmicutes bacterium]|nr:GNAT family N-acetyltransferase [Bacillota bacterium]
MVITEAALEDVEVLSELDRHLRKENLPRKIRDKEILVLRKDDKIVGWLRYGYFWDNLPFMNLLFILEPYRFQGLGSRLVAHWEQAMKERGHRIVMTSTQADEEGQHFYRKLGYRDIGGFVLPGEPLELIMIKE